MLGGALVLLAADPSAHVALAVRAVLFLCLYHDTCLMTSHGVALLRFCASIPEGSPAAVDSLSSLLLSLIGQDHFRVFPAAVMFAAIGLLCAHSLKIPFFINISQ